MKTLRSGRIKQWVKLVFGCTRQRIHIDILESPDGQRVIAVNRYCHQAVAKLQHMVRTPNSGEREADSLQQCHHFAPA